MPDGGWWRDAEVLKQKSKFWTDEPKSVFSNCQLPNIENLHAFDSENLLFKIIMSSIEMKLEAKNLNSIG